MTIPAYVPTTIAAHIAGVSRRAFVRWTRPQLVNGRGTYVSTQALGAHLCREITPADIVSAQMKRRTQYRTKQDKKNGPEHRPAA